MQRMKTKASKAASLLVIQHQGSSGRLSDPALADLHPAVPSNGRWQEDRLSTNGAKRSPRSHRQLSLGVRARPSQYEPLIFVTHGLPGCRLSENPGSASRGGQEYLRLGTGGAAAEWELFRSSLAITWLLLCPAPAGDSPPPRNSKRAAVIKWLLV